MMEKMVVEEEEEKPSKFQELSPSAQCCRGVLYCFNLFFVFIGIALISIGAWVQFDFINNEITILLDNDLFLMAGKIIMIAGIMILIVAMLGCLAARCENKCLLLIYFILLLVVFVIEFIGGSLGFAFLAGAETEQNLTWSLRQNYNMSGGEIYSEAWDFIQRTFRCCGVSGNVTQAVIEYRMTNFWLRQDPRVARNVVPRSCCRKGVPFMTCQLERPINQYRLYINDVGCLFAVESRVVEYGGVIGAVAITLSFMQLVGMVMAFCLWKQI